MTGKGLPFPLTPEYGGEAPVHRCAGSFTATPYPEVSRRMPEAGGERNVSSSIAKRLLTNRTTRLAAPFPALSASGHIRNRPQASEKGRGRTGAFVTPRACAGALTWDAYRTANLFRPTSHRRTPVVHTSPPHAHHQRGSLHRGRTTVVRPCERVEAHFPPGPASGTLRDRMLHAKLPCRHTARW
jgi:hypothetical protein